MTYLITVAIILLAVIGGVALIYFIMSIIEAAFDYIQLEDDEL